MVMLIDSSVDHDFMDQLQPVRQRLALLRRQPYQPWLAMLLYLLAALYLTAPIHSAIDFAFCWRLMPATHTIWFVKYGGSRPPY